MNVIQFPKKPKVVPEEESPVLWVERHVFIKLINTTRDFKSSNRVLKAENRFLKKLIVWFIIYLIIYDIFF
jgi:hypothetical protein